MAQITTVVAAQSSANGTIVAHNRGDVSVPAPTAHRGRGVEPVTGKTIIAGYRLTSANDFPQRDPRDWRLLGSNDKGTNWTVIDVRKGILFAERHEQRAFEIDRPQAFSLYRFAIDAVRESGADAVQLAELELVGANGRTVNPLPAIGNSVTCEGENSPLETRFQAFDGLVETKWLDHAGSHAATRSSWIQWGYSEIPELVITNLADVVSLRGSSRGPFRIDLPATVCGLLPDGRLCLIHQHAHLDLEPPATAKVAVPGQAVQITGTALPSEAGLKLAESVIVARSGQAPTNPASITLEEPIACDSTYAWIEAQGTMQFQTRSRDRLLFELADDAGHLPVQLLHLDPKQPVPANGTRVSVRGVCRIVLGDRDASTPGLLFVSNIGDIRPLSVSPPPVATVPVTNRAENLPEIPVLTCVEQVRQMRPEALTRWPKVKTTGVITELFGGYMQEGSAGIEIWHGNRPAGEIPRFGTLVEIEGRGDWAPGHGPIIRADVLRVLGPGKIPKAEHCSWSQLASGRMVDQWVEIEGVVRATDGSHLLLSCEGGQLMATLRSAAAPKVKELVDATVRIRGVSVAASDNRGRMQGVQLVVPSLEFVEIAQAPQDPFALGVRQIGGLLQVRGPKEFLHRVKIEGVLTLNEDRQYFIQDATGGATAILKGDVILATASPGSSWLFWQSQSTTNRPSAAPPAVIGDLVHVVGFPELRGSSLVLTESILTRVSRGIPIDPLKASVKEILGGGLDSTLVELEAVLLHHESLGSRAVLELQSEQHVFQAILRTQPERVPTLVPGSRIRVTGICQTEPVAYSELGKRAGSFKLLVRTPADLAVLQVPPWSELKRVLVIVAVLLVIIAFAVAWIAILKRQVAERTKLLQAEITDHEKTETLLAAETRRLHEEVEERRRIEAENERTHQQLLLTSRLAGMAEVSTSVLHNVGNVLNSANVLTSVIREKIRGSKVSSVNKLARLLQDQHAGGEAAGADLPQYVHRLGAHLAEEQTQILQKMTALDESLQHIKQIVAVQQNYAKVSGVHETVSPEGIVEDALRMQSGSLARHEIELVRDYEPTPVVTIDRHKVLQILFNLLDNAKRACAETSAGEKRIAIQIRATARNTVTIRVSDNGVGIPPENLKAIFGQGFSTRRDGHGLGLHSSVLAAQDLGGTLSATSDGLGKGAAFVLELPTAILNKEKGGEDHVRELSVARLSSVVPRGGMTDEPIPERRL